MVKVGTRGQGAHDRGGPVRDAVVLAAGMGTRLRASAEDLPKPLHEVGGVSLIKQVIFALVGGGVRRVIVVTGFMGDLVRATLRDDPDLRAASWDLEFAHNPDFTRSNGLSVLVGAGRCAGWFLLSMADHLYPSEIVRRLVIQPRGVADLYLATDPRVGDVLDLDDATKVRTEGGRIVAIGKTLAAYDRIDCGVFYAGPQLCVALDAERAVHGDCSLSAGVQRLADRGRARITDIGDAVWQDVDTPADRLRAEERLAATRAATPRRHARRTGARRFPPG